jgi:Beta-propeller repeat
MRWVAFLLFQGAFVDSFTADSYSFGITAIKVDMAGNTYLTGATRWGGIPVTPDAYQPQPTAGSGGSGPLVCTGPPLSGIPVGPCLNAFLVKLDPGGAVVYGTYLGGAATAYGMALAIDSAGNIYVCGLTQPPGFPITPGAAFPTANESAVSAFVQKFDPSLHHLVYSTYIPGITYNAAMAIDAAGNAYVAGTTRPACLPAGGCGSTYSSIFPATPGAFQTSAKNNSAAGVVVALNASGSALIYATYLSGSVISPQQTPDQVVALAVDASGDAFVTGFTGASDFPITSGAFQTKPPNSTSAAFVTKLNPQGTALVYSTLLGGNGADFGEAIKVDSRGEAWVLGQTSSTNFPLTPSPFESTPDDHFLIHLSADGASLSYATYFPGILGAGQALDLNAEGEPYVASTVSALNLPTGPSAFESNLSVSGEVYIAQFAAGGRFAGGSYLGGSSGAYVNLMAAAPDDAVVVTGITQSSDFPGITLPLPGGRVTYVAKLVPWRRTNDAFGHRRRW